MEKIELQKYKFQTNYNLYQLELDYYQHYILEKLYKKYNSIYFKGGTCLQKCYGIKRFSEDLDFNYENIEIQEIIDFIKSLFDTEIIDYKKTRFGTSFSIRFQGILFNDSEQSLCKISFDFRKNDTYNKVLKKIIRPIYSDLPNYFLLALDEEEILAEKIRAVITRIKARDVFDLNELLLNKIKIDFELINKKLKSYDKKLNLDELEEKLEEKRKVYDVEMERLTDIYEDFDTCKKRILSEVKKAVGN